MEIALVVLGLYAIATTVMVFVRKPAAAPALPSVTSTASSKPATQARPAIADKAGDEALAALERKLAEAKADAQSSREKLASKQKELDDVREQARAKARREGKKEARENDDADKAKGPDPRDTEIQSLRKGMAGLESQLNALKREAAARDASTSEASNKTAAEVESAKKQAEGERDRRRSLEDEAASLRKTIDELRGALKKADARPDVPGSALNLKELPTAAVQELSRYFRKGEEFERLYTVSQSQLQLEKDRYLELQRRYFAVCRELAVQAGLPANASEADLQRKAEAVVDHGNEQLAARQARLAQGPQTASAPKDDGADAAGADAKKKRRRRRRRKVVGEPSVIEAADGSDGSDEGDDGEDDEGSEGDVAQSSDTTGGAAGSSAAGSSAAGSSAAGSSAAGSSAAGAADAGTSAKSGGGDGASGAASPA
jgi:hypothetical protein